MARTNEVAALDLFMKFISKVVFLRTYIWGQLGSLEVTDEEIAI